MKKVFFCLASACLLFSSNLSARYQDYENCGGTPYRDACEWLIGSFTDWCNNWCIDVDYLYWTPRRCELDYAVPANSDGTGEFDGDVFEVDPDYTSGFRIELTKCFCDWDFGVRYTRLHTDDKDDAQNPPAGLGSTRNTGSGFAIGVGGVLEADARYDVDLDVVDLEIGCQYQPFCKGCYRVYAGAKLAYIDQRFLANYMAAPPNVIRYRGSVKMDAYGMYLGTKGTRYLCCLFDCIGLELFGDFSVGGLVGTFDRRAVIDAFIQGPGPVGVGFEPNSTGPNVADSCERLVWNGNLTIGLNFELNKEMWWCTRWHLSAGYEMHLWANMADFMTVITSLNGGRALYRDPNYLGFDGAFVRLGVCY